MRRFRIAAAVLVTLSLMLTAPIAVEAKGGDVVATLDEPLPVDSAPGTTVRIAWTLTMRFDDGSIHPYLAEGIFLRLSPASGTAIEVPARSDREGHFVASVTVPSGGLGTVAIGLQGVACHLNEGCTRADELFRIAPKPASAGAAAPAAAAPAAAPAAAAAARSAGAPAADPAAAAGAIALQPSPAADPPAVAPQPVASVMPDLAPIALFLVGGIALLGMALAVRGRGRPAAA